MIEKKYFYNKRFEVKLADGFGWEFLHSDKV